MFDSPRCNRPLPLGVSFVTAPAVFLQPLYYGERRQTAVSHRGDRGQFGMFFLFTFWLLTCTWMFQRGAMLCAKAPLACPFLFISSTFDFIGVSCEPYGHIVDFASKKQIPDVSRCLPDVSRCLPDASMITLPSFLLHDLFSMIPPPLYLLCDSSSAIPPP